MCVNRVIELGSLGSVVVSHWQEVWIYMTAIFLILMPYAAPDVVAESVEHKPQLREIRTLSQSNDLQN